MISIFQALPFSPDTMKIIIIPALSNPTSKILIFPPFLNYPKSSSQSVLNAQKRIMSLQSRLQQSRDSCGFSLSPGKDEDDVEARSVLCLMEVEEQSRDRHRCCLDSNVCVDDCIKVELETADEEYSHCIVLDIVPESCSLTPGCKGEHHGSNVDGLLANMQKVFQRQASLKNEKPAAEKGSDSSNNKWRKYKRAASFNPRKIVFLFSVLSSLGTLVLIYLTLRVKLHGDGYEHTS